MQDYNFWADLLFTFQSSPDWIKGLWLVVPPGFLLGLMFMLTRRQKPATISEHQQSGRGELLYSVHRDIHGELQITSHVDVLDNAPVLLVVEKPNLDLPALPSRAPRG